MRILITIWQFIMRLFYTDVQPSPEPVELPAWLRNAVVAKDGRVTVNNKPQIATCKKMYRNRHNSK